MSSKKLENHDSSIISNVSFFNTLQNEKKIDSFNYNSKSRKSVEEDSREVIYDYSLTNSSNANQTLHSKNRNLKNKNNETYNDPLKNVRFENEFLNQTVLKVKKINDNFKGTLKKPISVFNELQNEYSELDNEIFELYSDYFEKNQSKLISKIDQYKKILDETINERDEYKDYVESLLKENEEKSKLEMEAKKEKSNLVMEKNRLLSKIQSLQKNLDDLTHEDEMQRQEFNDICNKLTTKNVEMEKENHELQERLITKEKEITKLTTESLLLEIVQNAYDQIAKNQFTEFQIRLSDLQTKNEELHRNHKIYKSQTELKIKEYSEKLQYYRIQEKRFLSLKPENSSSEIINTSSSITLKSENMENVQTSRKIKIFDDNKGVLKKKIQNWMDNFKKKENRPPSVEDRIPIAALYSSSRDATDELLNRNNLTNNDGQSAFARFHGEEQRKNNNTSVIEQISRLNIEEYKKNMNNVSMIEPPIVSRFSKHERQKVLRNESFAKVQKIKHMTRNSISNNLNNITVDIINKSSRSVSPRKAHLNKIKARHAPNISVQVFDDNESRISNDLKERSLEVTQSTKARNLNETMINNETNDDDPSSNSILSINDLKSSKLNDGEENINKNRLQEIIKNKDQQMKKLRQDFLKLKENYEKNNNLLLQTNEKLRIENQNLVSLFKIESSKRKAIHNQLEDIKGKVRVYCRTRPLLNNEIEKGSKSVVLKKDELSLMLRTKNEDKLYNFDACFFESATQENLFEDTKSLIKSALDGYNVCIFAYGQTGSGKTYTILGDSNNPGIIPRSVEEMYKLIEDMSKFSEIKISVVIFELYMDNLIDLLLSKEKKNSGNIPHLEIKEDVKGNNYISNITTIFVKNKEELDKVIKIGMANRKIGKTDMNEESSRSHLIITISTEIYDRKTDTKTMGKLSLIDLAGSERANKSNLSLKQLNESRGINKSLSALGNVIYALTTDEAAKKHIPYRDNKLTMIMKDSLGGTSKTLMIVNISPADFNLEETQNSLYYGMRVKNVNNEQIKNVDSGEKLKLNEKLKSLFEENENLKKNIRKFQLNQKEKENAFLNVENVRAKEESHVLNEIQN